MYLSLILFLISLLGITFMIGSKLSLVRNGHTLDVNHSALAGVDLDKIKESSVKNARRFGYVALFVVLRLFIKTSHYLKIKAVSLAKNVVERFNKKSKTNNGKVREKEASGYLKTISEYRQKIRTMKERIKEAEGIE